MIEDAINAPKKTNNKYNFSLCDKTLLSSFNIFLNQSNLYR